jgi:hypothetical protein
MSTPIRIDDETGELLKKIKEITGISKQDHIKLAVQRYVANFQANDIIDIDEINKLKGI